MFYLCTVYFLLSLSHPRTQPRARKPHKNYLYLWRPRLSGGQWCNEHDSVSSAFYKYIWDWKCGIELHFCCESASKQQWRLKKSKKRDWTDEIEWKIDRYRSWVSIAATDWLGFTPVTASGIIAFQEIAGDYCRMEYPYYCIDSTLWQLCVLETCPHRY